jgi:hypothetical protein
MITTEKGSRLLPSVVSFTKTGERLVGQTAQRQSVITWSVGIILNEAMPGEYAGRIRTQASELQQAVMIWVRPSTAALQQPSQAVPSIQATMVTPHRAVRMWSKANLARCRYSYQEKKWIF